MEHREHHQSTEAQRPPTRGWRKLLLVVGAVLVVLIGLIVLGAFVPGIPGVGLVGSTLSGYAAWIAVAALVGTAACIWLVIRRRAAWRVAFLAITGATAIGAVVITGQLMAVGSANGAPVNPFASPVAASAPDDTHVYARADGSPLDVAVWKPSAPRSSSGTAPVVMFVHGGGWISGSATDDSGDKRWYADHGWLVLSVDYSLSSDTKHEWNTAVRQVECAMVWAGDHAADYNGDISRFAVIGDSAGGNLAINASYRADSGSSEPSCAGTVPKVSAVATAYPAVDPVSFYDNDDLLLGPASKGVAKYLGGTPTEYPDRYRSVASTTYITPEAPPTLVLAATSDHLVPPIGAYRFVDEARGAGVDVSLVKVPHAEHVFDLAPLGKQLRLGITEAWLEDQGLLD
ncbi:alpha/beta hydrolase [Curtobacterium sp. VKM Ac-2887]|uniref:alpha/beta hydrolase n=1 Tax=Curtobacterium sp. VKM Ac-2887 TaxID=2783819 RepID=UPI00188AD8B8|nr:alpha/beta hydrolase [Curtobacterium sp. VKM Ac-2887]MBF4585694.1 alpha/beta hydrolase [Curtobacterium sp. VKM Ac-2887]